MGPGAFFDLPWLPFYLAICFAFHWLLGVTALVGAIILVTLTLITEYMSRTPAKEAMSLAARRNDLAASSRRNAEVLVAMGMAGRMNKRWNEANEEYLSGNQLAERRHRRARRGRQGAAHDAAVRRARGRRLSRDPSGGHRRHHHRRLDPERAGAGAGRSRDRALEGFVAARQSWQRLNRLLQQMPARPAQTLLQAPQKKLSVEAVTMVRAGRPARHRAGRHLRASKPAAASA